MDTTDIPSGTIYELYKDQLVTQVSLINISNYICRLH